MTLLETDTLETITATTNQTSITLSFQIPSFTYEYTVAARTIALGPASPEMNITMPEDGKLQSPSIMTLTLLMSLPLLQLHLGLQLTLLQRWLDQTVLL